MSASSKTPFTFTWSSRSLSEWSLPPEHWWDCSITPKDWTCYCTHIRMTLGEGRGDHPPSHAWSGSLIVDTLQEACPRDRIIQAIVLSLGRAILFFGRCSRNEGLLYWKVKDIELGLRGSLNWAGKPAQIEETINTMQEGHQAIAEAVVEKKTKARGAGCPWGMDESHPGPHHSIQHWRVDVRLGRSSLQWGSEK